MHWECIAIKYHRHPLLSNVDKQGKILFRRNQQTYYDYSSRQLNDRCVEA